MYVSRCSRTLRSATSHLGGDSGPGYLRLVALLVAGLAAHGCERPHPNLIDPDAAWKKLHDAVKCSERLTVYALVPTAEGQEYRVLRKTQSPLIIGPVIDNIRPKEQTPSSLYDLHRYRLEFETESATVIVDLLGFQTRAAFEGWGGDLELTPESAAFLKGFVLAARMERDKDIRTNYVFE